MDKITIFLKIYIASFITRSRVQGFRRGLRWLRLTVTDIESTVTTRIMAMGMAAGPLEPRINVESFITILLPALYR
jgi:hypothetical protein